ncbi:cysteine-rich KTR domain-containing protein [Enterocloster clostridioformis]|uniref:Uncharacterized protein n=1 Tax=Enterocloster clostridioformis TaxID=1531 RepID=A0A1I0GQ81_9FIRM|nr:cysteine-rich KTR domain-containing protein [Enterocloster clostridioformis]SET72322.1 hypothetical protein SAMN05216521_1020102 [Enterocloster clostridioformis]SEW16130.1 hypothetical protein SAMN05216528_101240 [Enterocloster clostridioformis]
MLLSPEREYDIPLRHCTIKIDENLYPAEMQEHRLISEGLNANMKKVTDCRIIRKYTFEKPIAVFKPEPFKVECDDGHCSICYMGDNRLSIIEMEGTKMDFSKAMNPPEDGFDGQADIKDGWIICPYCQKKQFKVNSDTRIEKMPYKCKNSRCRKEIIVNVE